VAFFTLPTYPRSEVVPTDTANVLWNQPQDSQIFRAFRNDVPASKSLFATGAAASASATPSASTPVSPAATAVTPSPAVSSSGAQGSSGTASSGTAAGPATASPQPTVTPSLPIPSARTANQNICTG